MFEMGTGVSSPLSSPGILSAFSFYCLLLLLTLFTQNCTASLKKLYQKSFSRSSPRPISTGQLNTLLYLHLRPIYLFVFQGPYRSGGNKHDPRSRVACFFLLLALSYYCSSITLSLTYLYLLLLLPVSCLLPPERGKPYLEAGFALRCFQHLSLPDLATQLCHWHNNWCTSGLSTPVLSY